MEVDMKVVYGIREERPNGSVSLHNFIYTDRNECARDINKWKSEFPHFKFTLVSFWLV